MRVRLFTCLAIAIGGVLLGEAQGVASGEPGRVHVSGTYLVTGPGMTTCTTWGSPQVFRCDTTGLVTQYNGSLTGTSTTDQTLIINCYHNKTYGYGKETFTGSITTVGVGSLTWRFTFSSRYDCNTLTESAYAKLGLVVSGTADFSRLRGRIDFGKDTYDGDLFYERSFR